MFKFFYITVLLVFLLGSSLDIFAEPRRINIVINSQDKIFNNFVLEIRELMTSPYEQNYCNLGLVEKFDYKENRIYTAILDDSKLYYFNISPFNIWATFIPKCLDTISINLSIDEYPKIQVKSKDSINIEFNNFLKWKYDNMIYLYENKIYNKKYSDFVQKLDSLIKTSYFYVNYQSNEHLFFIDSITFKMEFYNYLLNFIDRKDNLLTLSEKDSLLTDIENFINLNCNVMNVYHLSDLVSLSYKLIKLKVSSVKKNEKSKLNNFLSTLELLKKYPERIKYDLLFSFISYSIYYNEEITDTIVDYVKNTIVKNESSDNILKNYFLELINKNINEKLFNFAFITDSSGNMVDHNIYNGKVVLVVFWTSWCSLCKEIIAQIETLKEIYSNEKFSIIYISLDSRLDKWKNHINNLSIQNNYILLGNNNNKLCRELFITGVPECFLIDKKGRVFNDEIPLPLNKEQLIKDIQFLINKK